MAISVWTTYLNFILMCGINPNYNTMCENVNIQYLKANFWDRDGNQYEATVTVSCGTYSDLSVIMTMTNNTNKTLYITDADSYFKHPDHPPTPFVGVDFTEGDVIALPAGATLTVRIKIKF